MFENSLSGAVAVASLLLSPALQTLAYSQSGSATTAAAERAERATRDASSLAVSAAGAESAIDASLLATKLGLWRERLNLHDWNITIVMKRRTELKPRTLGQIHWDKSKNSAVIWVLDASDYDAPAVGILNDMEFTVVHELLHLKFASSRRSEASRRTEEHAVNHIAEALLKLDRRN